MSDPINPRRPARYPVPVTGGIGAVEAPRTFGMGMYRPVILKAAKDYLSSIMGAASEAVRPAPEQDYGLGLGEAVRWGANKGREFVADSLERASTAYDDSANNLPLVRMPNGIMSLQVDERLLDMFDATTLGAMGVTHLGKGLVRGTQQAIREFLEAGVRAGGQIIAGRKSRTADLAALKRAETLDDRLQMAGDPKMEAQKRDYIYRETGWWKGKDGQWRYWLDDSQAKLTDQMIEQKVAEGRPVTTVMQHDLLYDAYPELMQRNVGKIELDPTQPRAGDFRAATGQINMRAPDTEGLRKGVLHEMNHGVQDVEGFAPGGNPEYAQEAVRRRLENDPYLPPEQQLSLDDHALLTHLVNQPVEAYRSLSGEAESRLVEILSGRKPSRNYPPYKRFDVKEDQQLVLTGERDRPVQLSLDPEDGRLPGLPESVALPDGTAAPTASSKPLGKQKVAVNIGLMKGKTGELYSQDDALQALRDLGVDVKEHGVLGSKTEPTLVAELDRPLTAQEMDSLAAKLEQEAIAQKVGKQGELYGPKAAEWGPFNDDYFIQLQKLREAAKKGQADPPIFDYGLLERDPGHRVELPLYDPPRGTPEREARLLKNKGAFSKLVEFARKGMTNDGLGWYNTEELRQEFIKEFGDEDGVRAYEQFIDLVGATSAGARTDANLKIASYYYGRNRKGLPPEKPAKGSGYGHKAQNLHFENARDILEGRPLDPFEHPKRSRFAANLKGDWRHSTIDKHNVRALAIASRDKAWVATKLEDTKGAGKPEFWNEKKYGEWNPATFNPREFVERTRMPFDRIPVTWFESAPKGTAYKALSQLNERLAAELGVTPAQAQAALWLGAGDMTGLGSKPIALMKVLDQRLAITARKRKITKREALRQMITGENPLLGVAGAASLLPLLAEDEDGA